MQIRHISSYAVVAAAALLSVGQAAAQAGAGAMFEGRPAMSGAQGGLGAAAGPPQGGIGLQGSEGTQIQLRRPAIVDTPANMPQGTPADAPAGAVVSGTQVRADELTPATKERDPGMAKPQRSASDKVRRSAQRTKEGAKYGVSPIDAR